MCNIYSAVSTQAMLGMPTDVYLTGAMLFWFPVAVAIGVLFTAFGFFPLFQGLGILSINHVFNWTVSLLVFIIIKKKL